MSAMEAAKQGRKEQLRVLGEYFTGEAPVEFINHQGKAFAEQFNRDMFEGQRVPIKIKFNSDTIFLDAASQGDEEEVERMLKEDNIDPNVANADGLTALHQCCIENSLKLANLLVRSGADVNAKDNDWWTPLHAASACGHWRVVNFLLQQNANIACVNADGDLPIDIAEGEKTEKILQDEMLRQGLDENKVEEIRQQAEKDMMELVRKMVADGSDINTLDGQGAAPIHAAACNGWLQVVEFLLDNGADVNLQDFEGNTALHLASFFQQYRLVELLGKKGANTDITNRHLESAIVLTEDVTMIRLLKALKNKQSVDTKEDGIKRPRLNSSVQRKSRNQKVSLAKRDQKGEGSTIESNYAELNFPKRGSKDAVGGGAAAAVSAQQQVIYSSIDHEKQAKAAEQNMTDLYSKPVKKGSRKNGDGAVDAADVRVQSGGGKPGKFSKDAPRKPSLAAIALDGDQAAAEAGAESSSAAANGKSEGGGGGCCVIQ